MNKKILASLFALSFVFTACSKNANEAKDTKEETKLEESADNKKDTATDEKNEKAADDKKADAEIVIPETKISLKAASYEFEKHIGGQPYKLTEVKFEKEDSASYYEFEGNKNGDEYSLKVNAENGEIIEKEAEKSDDNENEIDLGKAIPPQEAIRIALESNGGGLVKEWKLTNDGKTTKYEIELEDDKEIVVDAITKDVLK